MIPSMLALLRGVRRRSQRRSQGEKDAKAKRKLFARKCAKARAKAAPPAEVSEELAMDWLKALHAEHVLKKENAMYDFFNADTMTEEIEDVLEPFEEAIELCEDRDAAIKALAKRWGLNVPQQRGVGSVSGDIRERMTRRWARGPRKENYDPKNISLDEVDTDVPESEQGSVGSMSDDGDLKSTSLDEVDIVVPESELGDAPPNPKSFTLPRSQRKSSLEEIDIVVPESDLGDVPFIFIYAPSDPQGSIWDLASEIAPGGVLERIEEEVDDATDAESTCRGLMDCASPRDESATANATSGTEFGSSIGEYTDLALADGVEEINEQQVKKAVVGRTLRRRGQQNLKKTEVERGEIKKTKRKVETPVSHMATSRKAEECLVGLSMAEAEIFIKEHKVTALCGGCTNKPQRRAVHTITQQDKHKMSNVHCLHVDIDISTGLIESVGAMK